MRFRHGFILCLAMSVASCASEIPSDCIEGVKQCSPDQSSVQICTDGAWATVTPCGDLKCNPATGQCHTSLSPDTPNPGRACQVGEKKCDDTGSLVMQCNPSGEWILFESCASGRCDVSLSACISKPECEDQALRCDADGSRLLECQNGTWMLKQNCQ